MRRATCSREQRIFGQNRDTQVDRKGAKMIHQKSSLSPSLGVGVALAFTILLAQPAVGQNTPPPTSPPAPPIVDPKACLERLPPNDGTARQPGASTQNLSDKLERSEGVICPPVGIDPDIAVVPPGGGRTPVIPPPGSPGGDPTVRPK